MSRVTMYSPKLVNTAASHHVDTQLAIDRHTERIAMNADGYLKQARASTTAVKYWPHRAGETEIKHRRWHVDGLVWMEGDNPAAIEFGHRASGHYHYGRAPTGLYIITRAALGG